MAVMNSHSILFVVYLIAGLFNAIATLLQVFVFPKWAFTEDELKGLRLTQEYQKKGSGYAEIQGSKPQTLVRSFHILSSMSTFSHSSVLP